MSRSEQRLQVDRSHSELSISEQCAALGLSRSTLYYKPKPASEEDLRIMRFMDELHLEDPTRGQRRMLLELKDLGFQVGRARVRSLMRRMRLCCVYRRPRTTVIDKTRYKHPYLLRGLKVERPHQVWAIDITYIPMRGGYMYLCAIIDLYSRYIVGWSVSNTMEAEWVCSVVRDAVAVHGKPEIINSDQAVLVGVSEPTNTVDDEYFLENVNLDAVVRYTGPGNDRDPILQTVGASVPTNTRAEQLP
jgi:putative transposase